MGSGSRYRRLRLGVAARQVYNWISAGELAATRFGPQTIRVRLSEIERFKREGIERRGG
ncbi:MAG: helix-turn-helix domain-containing protein [Rubrobacter sp.]|nr:helix-turn-helix domain-containing protein [Rubrobacter sp.]